MSDLPTLYVNAKHAANVTGLVSASRERFLPDDAAYVPASRLAAAEAERDAALSRVAAVEAALRALPESVLSKCEPHDLSVPRNGVCEMLFAEVVSDELYGAVNDALSGGTAALDAHVEAATKPLRDLLREAREALSDYSLSVTSSYGAFPGGDPRKFTPDPECSTDEERQAHRAACAKWDAGEGEDLPAAHQWLPAEQADALLRQDGADSASTRSGSGIAHVSMKMFGLGSYQYPDPETDALLAKIDAALAAKGGAS